MSDDAKANLVTAAPSLKGRFLKRVGYVCRANESASDAFDRLRTENPDLFPAPRAHESFWDAIREVCDR